MFVFLLIFKKYILDIIKSFYEKFAFDFTMKVSFERGGTPDPLPVVAMGGLADGD